MKYYDLYMQEIQLGFLAFFFFFLSKSNRLTYLHLFLQFLCINMSKSVNALFRFHFYQFHILIIACVREVFICSGNQVRISSKPWAESASFYLKHRN